MSVNLSPYLHFRGQAKEAMEFYQSVFGGELAVSTFGEFGGMGVPESEQGQVMHSQIDFGGFSLMGADTPSTMPWEKPTGFTVALSGDDEPTLRGWWDKLAEGATVDQPMELAPWGDYFGMMTDRFGISWMVNCAGPDNQPS